MATQDMLATGFQYYAQFCHIKKCTNINYPQSNFLYQFRGTSNPVNSAGLSLTHRIHDQNRDLCSIGIVTPYPRERDKHVPYTHDNVYDHTYTI